MEGIYSYQKQQTIDFTELTNAGLFGIFGAVASGKSTILEAISFALYGDSERMGGTNRNYNMMNLKSNRMYIDFEFLNFENKKYRAVREYRRNSKNFSDVKIHAAAFYEWKEEAWMPLEIANAEPIIGLSATNFKRTIIIPQGKFKEFIELKGTDRTNMMKELFNLHHYDLANNTRTLFIENAKKLDKLEGRLSGYEDISKEIVTEKTKLFTEQQTSFDKKEIEHKKLNEAFEELKQLSNDFQSLQQQNKKLASEEERKKEIEKTEKSLKLYVQTHQHFDEILRLKQQLGVDLAYENANLNNIVKNLAVNKEKYANNAERLTALKPFIDVIDTKKQEIIELELVSQILTYRAAIKKGEERTEKGRTVVDNLSKEVDAYSKEINEVDIKTEEIKSKFIDAKTLTAVELWFSANNALKKQLADRGNKLKDITKQIEATDNKFKELNYDKDNWKETIEAQSEQVNEQ
ncbi:MAG: AAA family ATPase, partial [Spirochaetales bacterium]|nr:AAA family ATPase [Spirochaetales bacterium]